MGGELQPSGRTLLIVLGVLLIAGGLLWPFLGRYFGRLPGDIVIKRENFTCVFPIVTSLLLSLVLSLLLWLLRR